MGALGLIVGLAIGILVVAAIILYFQYSRQSDELPLHTPQAAYVQQMPAQTAVPPQMPPQQMSVQQPVTTPVYAPPPPAPMYAPGQVVYTQAPPLGPMYAAPQGGVCHEHSAPSGGSGVSGATVAMGAAAGMVGGLLVGGMIASAAQSGGDSDDGGDEFAGDF